MQHTIRANRFPLFATIIGLTLSLFGPPALAQGPKPTHTTLHQALAGLRPGTALRVRQDLNLFQGTLRRVTRNDVVLVENQAEHTLPLGRVDTLWVSRRGRAGKGALIGGLIGLGTGLIAGAVAAPEGYTDTPKSAHALLGGGVGLLAGVVLGLLGGSEVRYWDRAYPQANR